MLQHPQHPLFPRPCSYLAFGTSANAEFVQNLLLGLWECAPALFEEHSRGSLNWIKLSSDQLYSLIWGQRKFHPYSFERVSSCLHPHDSYISGSLQLWQCFSHPLIVCCTQKESFTYWSAGALKCCHNMMYPGGTLQYEGHSWGGCRHPKSLFFNLCRSDGIDKLHYFLISHINIQSKYKRQQPLWPNSY